MTRQKEKSETTRKELQEAMVQLFLEKGYEETSIKDITDQAGYAVGSFYRQWKSKQQAFMEYWDGYVAGFIKDSVEQMPASSSLEDFIKYLIRRSEIFSKQEVTKKLYITNQILSAVHKQDKVKDWSIAYNKMIFDYLKKITNCEDKQKLTSTANILHYILDMHAMQYATVRNEQYFIDNDTLETSLTAVVRSLKETH